MKTHAEAVAYLRSLGFEANQRDWSFGESVVAGISAGEADGIRLLSKMVCIFPEGRAWSCENLSPPKGERKGEVFTDLTLEAACEMAVTLLRDTSGGAAIST
jgi:hypothetical protein